MFTASSYQRSPIPRPQPHTIIVYLQNEWEIETSERGHHKNYIGSHGYFIFVFLQLQMLGYDISWAAFNVIEVMSCTKFTVKVKVIKLYK